MPFPETVRAEVQAYAGRYIGDLAWHYEYFSFVRNRALRTRLAKEFWSARFVYKLLEGCAAKGALQRAQVKLQILQYASIYEAVLHYLLFSVYRHHGEVRALRTSVKRTDVSVRHDLMVKLVETTKVPNEELRVCRVREGKADISKIRFDAKVNVAKVLGLVTPALAEELNEIFSARNSIHLHAEIRKNLQYGLDLSLLAYRRMRPFRDHLVRRLVADGKRAS